MPECFSSTQLAGVLNKIKQPNPFLLRRFFPNQISFTTEKIEWHIKQGGKRLAPFVSPCVKGVVMADRGHEEKSFKPAYVKPKFTLDPCKMFVQRAGEICGTELSPADRLNQARAEALVEGQMMIDNRLEWMAAKALQDGKYLVSGDDYEDVEVDFKRNPAHEITPANDWTDLVNGDPMADIDAAVAVMSRTPGAGIPDTIIMGGSAWAAAKVHNSFNDLLDTDIAGNNSTADRGPLGRRDGVQVANLSGRYDVWVYDDYYEDNDGDEQPFIDPKTVVLASSSNLDGHQLFGAIRDVRNLQATRIFSKEWEEDDPSMLYLMMQSAPLVVPVNVNATARLTVLP